MEKHLINYPEIPYAGGENDPIRSVTDYILFENAKVNRFVVEFSKATES
ncbi:MAG: hypothetical protein OEQ39_02310 [Gammaproteobacteria bacterium]|nr:hypothetical protein [Gammaproteobacteria bacterium]MDH3375785.1 hypothetical protein [Gammaproteobacteria bacterium]